MKRYQLTSLLLIPLLAGCFSSGAFYSANLTGVELAEENFAVVATSVSGQAEAEYLFGLSGSLGPHAQTVALARGEAMWAGPFRRLLRGMGLAQSIEQLSDSRPRVLSIRARCTNRSLE